MHGNLLNPLDGRYHEKTRALSPYFSEEALMKYRLYVEVEYLIALSEIKNISLRKFSAIEIKFLRDLYKNFNEKEFKLIKIFEEKTNHDIKAIEYFLKEKISKKSLKDCIEWIHFALTSEDINSVAYALILSDVMEKVIMPTLSKIINELSNLAKKYLDLPMLARTHGQPGSPTTFGKEIAVFVDRMQKQFSNLKKIKIEAKFSGATGNYSAHASAFPKINWLGFSQHFVDSFNKNRKVKLEHVALSTQVSGYDSYAEIFDNMKRINTILIDLNQDIWRYVSDEWLTQASKRGETGSSTMPHKINPIDFENSEGNLGLANALFEFFARKLPISRLQRDLSDSTVKRNFGTAFGYSFLAYNMLLKGLNKISPNEEKICEDLSRHPEVITEAIQTILRRENLSTPYEKLKKLTRGKKISLAKIHEFITSLKIAENVREELLAITPLNYTGLASKLASK